MEKLRETFARLIRKLRPVNPLRRKLTDEIDWNDRLFAIKGARGVGKTTLVLQHIKERFSIDETVLYVSLDDIHFSNKQLVDLAEDFTKSGGKFLFLDEVHKYPTWSLELKNIYDSYPELKVVFTGSSILQIYRGEADLSRRAISYDLHGLSFREFLELDKNMKFPVLKLDDIMKNHVEICMEISGKIKPLSHFKNYLNYGYYPYFKENIENYPRRLANVVNLILETDLPTSEKFDFNSIYKLKKLLYLLAINVPFKPNISRLSARIEVTRGTVMLYLQHLKNAHLINMLTANAKNLSHMAKPEKVYLNNTNLMYCLAPENVNKGNLRETFFYNQLVNTHTVTYTPTGDFLVDKKYHFEIGGRNKTAEQIASLPKGSKGFIAADNIELGFKNKIPLWLFGFLY